MSAHHSVPTTRPLAVSFTEPTGQNLWTTNPTHAEDCNAYH